MNTQHCTYIVCTQTRTHTHTDRRSYFFAEPGGLLVILGVYAQPKKVQTFFFKDISYYF